MVLIGGKVGEAPSPATGSEEDEEEEENGDDDCNEREAQKSAREAIRQTGSVRVNQTRAPRSHQG